MRFPLFIIFIFSCIFHIQPLYAIKESKIIHVGYLNYAKVIEKIDASNLQKQVDNLRQSYDEKITSMTQDITNLQNQISAKSDEEDITPLVSMMEQKQLDLSLLKIKETEDIDHLSSSILQEVENKIQPAIKNIAKRQNFDVILDSSFILLADPSLDITNYVLASL